MNPHKLTFGAAFDFPFALLVGGLTVVAWLFSREPKRIPIHPVTIALLLFALWISLTTTTALFPIQAFDTWQRTMKIILFNGFVTIVLMRDRKRIDILIWVIVVSLGFFGVKGGIFTIVSGGSHHVFGPPGSIISDNTQLALALLMVVPLMRYLQLNAESKWVRLGLLAAMLLTIVAILGSQSRGALVGLLIMLLALFARSRRRLLATIVVGLSVGIGINFMPDSWSARMGTIADYEEDTSVQGRFDAWRFAYETAKDHPVLGGGFFVVRMGGPRSAHSIYFQVLGEHSFVGLLLFLSLGFVAAYTGFAVNRRARGHPELTWARDLTGMLQVGLGAYAVSGAFVNLAYFDLFYHFAALMAATSLVVQRAVADKHEDLVVAPAQAGLALPVGRPSG